jgi:hypothetical protein
MNHNIDGHNIKFYKTNPSGTNEFDWEHDTFRCDNCGLMFYSTENKYNKNEGHHYFYISSHQYGIDIGFNSLIKVRKMTCSEYILYGVL